jgi:Mn-dependent DtxR family transcriptional regulator
MDRQTIQGGLLVTLIQRYEEDPHQFVTLSKQVLNSSWIREAAAELRNEGLVEERLRGVIRLTARGYKQCKTKLPFACAS